MKSDVKISDNRLVMTRVFDAPRQRVFDAWKNVDQLQRWWGCRMTTKVEAKMDFRPGGAFAHKMHITGAGEMVYTGAYDEIIEPEMITYHANFGPLTSRITVEFIEQGSHTKMILTQEGFPSADLCPIVSEGFTAAFDKLDRLLVPVAA
jgi:uncharacterized protein YndB with AHSA1/START domain